MKFISYFIEDIKNIIKKPASIGTLLALMIIPGFYAWFNIVASWNPYDNTNNIKVAVTNEDSGVEIFGKNINIGENVIHNLQNNHNLGWQFVPYETAYNGVLQGEYYASIRIGEDFSKNLLSFLGENPEKPELKYLVNEKLNAIAPKITGKGIESLSDAVEANFMSAIYENFFQKTNTIARKIQDHKTDIMRAESLIAELSDKLPAIYDTGITARESIQSAQTALGKAEPIIQELEKILQKIHTETGKTPDLMKFSEEIPQFVHLQINTLEMRIFDGMQIASLGNEIIHQNAEQLLPILEKSYQKMASAQKIVMIFEKFFQKLNTLSGKNIFSGAIGKLQNLQNRIEKFLQINNKMQKTLRDGEQISEALLGELMQISNALHSVFADVKDYMQNIFPQKIQEMNAIFSEIFKKMNEQIAHLLEVLPQFSAKTKHMSEVLNTGGEKLDVMLDNWSQIVNAIEKMKFISQKLHDNRIDSLLEIMLLNPDDEKNFFKNPVKIVTESWFASPNYGSAIAPFFVVLALWTGALLASSMLSVFSQKAEQEKNLRAGYLGRLLLFLCIGVVQAIVIVAGNIFVLGVYVVHPWALLFASILIVIVFHILVYSLVFLFGKIGNVLAIIILLVQLSAGSGTFPVELTNEIFIKIHPYIPFTYAINLLREVSLGVVPNILYFNIVMLVAMLIVFLGIGYALSSKMAPFAKKFNRRTEGMDIFE